LYEQLRRMKRPGESFSALINRLLKYKVKLTEVAGSKTITSKEWKEVEEAFKNQVKLDDARRKYLLSLISR
jgi:predicted CopG family antitoxin